jgi:RNA-directed DNA polymerase
MIDKKNIEQLSEFEFSILREIKTIQHLCDLLDVNKAETMYVMKHYPKYNKCYNAFKIPKKNNESRQIYSPNQLLKNIQKKLNVIFQGIYSTNLKNTVHGFVNDRSIITNARKHLNQKFVLNLDLKDFFPTIHYGRIKGVLMSYPFNLNSEISSIIANLCCRNNQLPQGAPTSPILTNFVCHSLDKKLQKLAIDTHTIYTRYADDITFSGRVLNSKIATIENLEGKPSEIILHDYSYGENVSRLILSTELETIINSSGFGINYSKVRLQTNRTKQEVTGIKVNKKLNVERSYIRNIRAMLHDWEMNGLTKAALNYNIKYNSKYKGDLSLNVQKLFKRVLAGKINFVSQVRGKEDSIYNKLRDKYLELNGYKPQHEEKDDSKINSLKKEFDFLKDYAFDTKEGLKNLNRKFIDIQDSLQSKPINHELEKETTEVNISSEKFEKLSNEIIQIKNELQVVITGIELHFSSLNDNTVDSKKKIVAIGNEIANIKTWQKKFELEYPIVNEPSIDYDYIDDKALKNKLDEHNIEMEKNAKREKFKDFCFNAELQVEEARKDFFKNNILNIRDNWDFIYKRIEKIMKSGKYITLQSGGDRNSIDKNLTKLNHKLFEMKEPLTRNEQVLIVLSFCYPESDFEPIELNKLYWDFFNINNWRIKRTHADENKEIKERENIFDDVRRSIELFVKFAYNGISKS